MTEDPDEERVGYKHPPKGTRFRPGRSGNPKGRRKHVHNFKTDLRDELSEQISIREGDREVKLTKQRAFIKALVAAAIEGDMRATSALVSFCTRTLGSEEHTDASDIASIEDLAIIESFVERERKRLSKNETDPDSITPKSRSSNNDD